MLFHGSINSISWIDATCGVFSIVFKKGIIDLRRTISYKCNYMMSMKNQMHCFITKYRWNIKSNLHDLDSCTCLQPYEHMTLRWRLYARWILSILSYKGGCEHIKSQSEITNLIESTTCRCINKVKKHHGRNKSHWRQHGET